MPLADLLRAMPGLLLVGLLPGRARATPGAPRSPRCSSSTGTEEVTALAGGPPRRGGERVRATLRVSAAVIAAACAAQGVAAVYTAVRAPTTTDYVAFETGAHILAERPHCLYCDDVQRDTQRRILGFTPSDTEDFPSYFNNPPLAAEVLRPLSGLALGTAVAVFTALGGLGLGLAVLLLARLLPPAWPPPLRWCLAVVAGASLPATTGLRLAQWDPFMALALAAAVTLLERRRDLAAGLVLSLLLVKPHLVLLAPVALLAGKRWRCLVGLGAGAVVWLVSGLALVGAGGLLRFADIAAANVDRSSLGSEGIPGLLAGAAGGGIATPAALLCLLAGAALIAALRHRLSSAPAVGVALGVTLSLLAAPHMFPDDLVLLGAPLVLLARARTAWALAAAVALSAAWWFDLHASLPAGLRHAETLVLLGIAAALVRALAPATAAGRAALARPSVAMLAAES